MKDRLIEPAKQFLIAYFSDGEKKQPSDFDDDIIGGDVNFFATSPRWNHTPFFKALGELVDEGIIEYEHTSDGYFYWLKTIQD